MGNKVVKESGVAPVPIPPTDLSVAWLSRQQKCDDGYFDKSEPDEVTEYLTPAEKIAASKGVEPPPILHQPITHWKRGELLGSGAFGRVYLALNEDNGTLMATKQISLSGVAEYDELVASLEAEIAIMAQLSHPSIVQYLGSSRDRTDKDGDVFNIFMEFVPGKFFFWQWCFF